MLYCGDYLFMIRFEASMVTECNEVFSAIIHVSMELQSNVSETVSVSIIRVDDGDRNRFQNIGL
jgi:hypothetical protein